MGYLKFKRPLIAPSFTPTPTGIALADLAQGTNGQLPIAQTSAATAYKTVSGDVTINQNGVTAIGAGKVLTGMIDPSVEQVVTVNLASADILALNGSPKALLASPGSGKVIVLGKIVVQFKHGTQYANGSTVVAVYHGQTAALTAALLAAVVNANADSVTQLGALASSANGQTLLSATGIDLYATAAEFITGTGTAIVTVSYKVITLG